MGHTGKFFKNVCQFHLWLFRVKRTAFPLNKINFCEKFTLLTALADFLSTTNFGIPTEYGYAGRLGTFAFIVLNAVEFAARSETEYRISLLDALCMPREVLLPACNIDKFTV